MRTTIDKAGRIVVPKRLRMEIGLVPGDLEIVVEGNGLRITPIATDQLDEVDGLLMLTAASDAPTDETIRELRLADQR